MLPTNSAVYTNLTTGSQWTLNQLTTSINSSAVSGGIAPDEMSALLAGIAAYHERQAAQP